MVDLTEHATLDINCFVRDPLTGESYTRDPRYIVQKAADYLASTGLADDDCTMASG